MDDAIKVEIGSSYRMNAGICGLVKFLEYAEEKGIATKGIDYEINKYDVQISNEFILNTDLENIFFEMTLDKFKDNTRLMNILNKKNYIDSIFEKETFTKDDEKEVEQLFTEFINKLTSASMIAGLQIVRPDKLTIHDGKTEEPGSNQEDDSKEKEVKKKKSKNIDEFQDFKKEKDLREKKNKYDKIYEIITEEKTLKMLQWKDICYSVITNLWTGTSFLYSHNNTKDPIDLYRKDFVEPLKKEIINKRKVKNEEKVKVRARCIECTEEFYGKERNITMIQGTGDDLGKKFSSFWDGNIDAYLCPVCAFTQSLIFFGFTYLGRELVFINNNENLKTMIRVMNSYESKNQVAKNEASFMKRVYGIFVDEKLSMNEVNINNIDVITKENVDGSMFKVNTIPKDMMEKIKSVHKQLVYLSNKVITATNEKKYYVYDEVFNNIANKRSQKSLINFAIKNEINDNGDAGYIKNIIDIELEFGGTEGMKERKKLAHDAWEMGKYFRNRIIVNVGFYNIEDVIKANMYRLLNAVQTADADKFMDTVIRLALTYGTNIPEIVSYTYSSNEEMQVVGYNFLAGLMNKEKKTKEANEIQEENIA